MSNFGFYHLGDIMALLDGASKASGLAENPEIEGFILLYKMVNGKLSEIPVQRHSCIGQAYCANSCRCQVELKILQIRENL